MFGRVPGIAYLVAALQGVPEGLEPGGVTGQLEYPQNAHDAKDLDDASNVLELSGALVGLDEAE